MSRKIPPARLAVFSSLLIFALIASCPVYAATSATVAWPGQSGNPVGYAAYGPLGTTRWPGGSFTSGTTANPTVYTGYVFTGALTISGQNIIFVSCDFVSGTSGVTVSGSNITFIGSRFQSNQVQYYNVNTTGTNITFLYDSFTPLVSLVASPPGEVWPSAGAGQNTLVMTNNVNATDGNSGYEFGVNINGGGPITIDHCDFWGFGNAIVFNNPTSTQMIVTSNWIHDAANISPQGYHTDGPGYLNGGAGPSNILVQGNTIASLGNSNGIAFQAATSGYSGINLINNFNSGFGNTVAPGEPGNAHFSNSSVMFNVWGTDVENYFEPLYSNSFPSTGNSVWACNLMSFRSGTTWTNQDNFSPTSALDGKYWVPSSARYSSTDYNGNTVCAALTPGSVNFKSQQTGTSSTGQTVHLTNAGTGLVTISSIALQTGSQFAISSNTCGSTLAVGSSCSFVVTFTPTSPGAKQDFVLVTDNSPAPSSPQSVMVIGTALGAGSGGTAPNPPTGLAAVVQ